VVTVLLPAHVHTVPELDPRTEEQISHVINEAGNIVSRLQKSKPEIAVLLKTLRKENLTDVEKDQVREELKQEISTALKDGRISPGMTKSFTRVYVVLLMKGIELAFSKPGESIVLYLGCRSVETLLTVRQMILSGLLLRLFSDVIKQFVQRQCQVQLVVQQEDYDMCLSCLSIAAGTNEKTLYSLVLFVKIVSQVCIIAFRYYTLKLLSCDNIDLHSMVFVNSVQRLR